MDRNYDHLFKVLLCGDSGVGKTCLISQFTDQQIRRTHITTIGIDFKLKTFTVRGKRVRLQIWDTAGQERFETLTAQYYRRAQGIMLVYDITQEQTFSNVSKWLRNIEENAVDDVKLVLVGNKLDLEQHRQVSTHKGEKLAKQHETELFETSAWTNQNIMDAFACLAEKILESDILFCVVLLQHIKEYLKNFASPKLPLFSDFPVEEKIQGEHNVKDRKNSKITLEQSEKPLGGEAAAGSGWSCCGS